MTETLTADVVVWAADAASGCTYSGDARMSWSWAAARRVRLHLFRRRP